MSNNPVLRKKIYAVINMVMVVIPILSLIYDYANKGNYGNHLQQSNNQDIVMYFNPAPYTFSIWFIIYIALFVFCVHQIKVAWGKTKDENTLLQIGPFLVFSLFFNDMWSHYWQGDNTENQFLNPLLLFASFGCLLKIIFNLSMQIENEPSAVKKYTWIPISIYSGWMMAASVVGMSTYLAQQGLGQDGTAMYWCVAIIIVAMGLYLVMLQKRNLVVFTLVGVWTLIGIAVNNWCDEKWIAWTAIGAALFLLFMIIQKMQDPAMKKLLQV